MATQIKDTAAFLGNALSGANSRASELILSTAQAADYTHEGVANVRRCLALTVPRFKDSGLGNREPGSALDGFAPTLWPSTILSHETLLIPHMTRASLDLAHTSHDSCLPGFYTRSWPTLQARATASCTLRLAPSHSRKKRGSFFSGWGGLRGRACQWALSLHKNATPSKLWPQSNPPRTPHAP
jgi:hypothetical protein